MRTHTVQSVGTKSRSHPPSSPVRPLALTRRQDTVWLPPESAVLGSQIHTRLPLVVALYFQVDP